MRSIVHWREVFESKCTPASSFRKSSFQLSPTSKYIQIHFQSLTDPHPCRPPPGLQNPPPNSRVSPSRPADASRFAADSRGGGTRGPRGRGGPGASQLSFPRCHRTPGVRLGPVVPFSPLFFTSGGVVPCWLPSQNVGTSTLRTTQWIPVTTR